MENGNRDRVRCNLPYRDIDSVVVEMNDTFTLNLKHPLSDEDWAKITDAELEHTSEMVFTTPSGKKVKFIKAQEF